jgi:DNA adenine methylase
LRNQDNSQAAHSKKPFLKWPGGKRWAANEIARIVSDFLSGTYYEPFLGGGSVFFSLRTRKAVLSDVNPDLINVYAQVKSCVEEVIRELKKLPVSREDYYRIRAARPRDPLHKAVRFLYLNRTAFAGMYRVNARGEFNVPYGGGDRGPALLWHHSLLEGGSAMLKHSAVLCADFEQSLLKAKKGDVAYCDPTYTVAHDQNCFRRYNELNFSWADQVRLASAAIAAGKRGATVLVSNAHHASIRELHKRATETRVLTRFSCVPRDPAKRRIVKEYLFVYHP